MKYLFLSFLALISITVTAQNTLPLNGKVGIGTMNPSAKLDVNGHTKIDSTLNSKRFSTL